ncbi:MAG TPA: GNAT family N-acetyltransferase [Saprospiraceae bacterium]|nr:GNAT family N-acetyltransferase [Saprospiraceae bacterium]
MKAKDVKLIPVKWDEMKVLKTLSRTTFLDAYGEKTRTDLMDRYLESQLSSENLSREWAHTASRFYFIIHGGIRAGYVKVNTGIAQGRKWNDTLNGFHLERIYVLKEFQGNGIGKSVLTLIESLAKKASATFIWLSVWDQNPAAIRFYEKSGFHEAGVAMFRFVTEDHTDYIMKKEVDKSTK